MRQLPPLPALAAALTLAACAPSGPTAPGPTAETSDACGASAAQAAVGTTRAEAEPIIRQASEAAGGTYRIVEHGQPMTMDFRADRLTARVARDGLIDSVACG